MASRDKVNPVWDLFDAARQHCSIRLDCPRCNHVAVYDAAGLWWAFERKGRTVSIKDLQRFCYCRDCSRFGGPRIRPVVKLCRTAPTQMLPLPSEADWKRAASKCR